MYAMKWFLGYTWPSTFDLKDTLTLGPRADLEGTHRARTPLKLFQIRFFYYNIVWGGGEIYNIAIKQIVFQICRIWNIYTLIIWNKIYFTIPTPPPPPPPPPPSTFFSTRGEAVAPHLTWNLGSAPGAGMDKSLGLQPLYSVGWSYLSISKLQRLNRWNLGIDKFMPHSTGRVITYPSWC